MQHTEIKNTGIFVPPIIFGTSALGNLYESISDQTKLEIVSEAFRCVQAPVVFDSAGKYGAGLALEKLGESLDKLNIHPDQVIISNKLGWKRTPLLTSEPTFEKGVWMNLKHDAAQDISYDGIMNCYHQGNELLGNKYFPQMASVHDPDEYLFGTNTAGDRDKKFDDIIHAYHALKDLKSEGKVKAIGVGSKDWKIIREISKEIDLDWVMFANSMTIYHHPADLLQFMQELKDKNVGVVNSAVFHAGFLIGGKYFDYRLIQPDTDENKLIFNWRDKFFAICKKHEVTPAQACVQFGMSAPGVVSIALNTSKPANIETNVSLVSNIISADFWQDMKENKLINVDYKI